MNEKLKEKMLKLCDISVDGYKSFKEEVESISEDDIDALLHLWHTYFKEHFEIVGALIDVKVAVDRIEMQSEED